MLTLPVHAAEAEQAGAPLRARPGVGRPLAGRFDAGASHTCAILDAGTVHCWGADGSGRLGYPELYDPVGDNEDPAVYGSVPLGPGRTAMALAAGGAHTCAIRDDGSLLCGTTWACRVVVWMD